MIVSKRSHVLRFWGLESQHMDLGGTVFSPSQRWLEWTCLQGLGSSFLRGCTRKEDSDLLHTHYVMGFPGGASGKEPPCQSRRHNRCRFDPWVRKIPWRGHGNPLQYSCLENAYGQRGLLGCSSEGLSESDMTEGTKEQQLQQYIYVNATSRNTLTSRIMFDQISRHCVVQTDMQNSLSQWVFVLLSLDMN